MSATAIESQALELVESISLAIEEGSTTPFDEHGTVPIHIIRPGIGKGKGKHLYEAAMLATNAGKFTGWRMYVDHQSPEARRAAGGLPRSVRDLGGRIVEAKWDPSVPADPKRGYGQGAVVGRAKPVPFIRELIENDPGLVEASISASATGVRPVTRDGQRVWLVEGISDRGSVDWVTEAGAGGRVAPLIESSYASEEAVEMALLESMSDEELAAVLAEERPNLKLGEASSHIHEKEDGMADLSAEALQEALSSHPNVLVEALQSMGLEEAIEQTVAVRVEEALQAEREIAEAERNAHVARQWELRDLRDSAQAQIRESRLPDTWKTGLETRFTLSEAHEPTPELDIVDDIDDNGQVTKTAAVKLREAVAGAIEAERDKLREVAPTRVRDQGPARISEGETKPEDAKNQQQPTKPAEKPYWAQILEAANVDPDKAYAE